MYDDDFVNLLASNQIVVPLVHDHEGYTHKLLAKDCIKDQVPLGATIRPVITKIICRRVPNPGDYIWDAWEEGDTIKRLHSTQVENVVDDIDPITVPVGFSKNTYSLLCKNIELFRNDEFISGRLSFKCIEDDQSYDMAGYTENTDIVAVVVKLEVKKASAPKSKDNGKPRNKPKKGIKASTLMLLMHMMNQNKKG